MVRPPKPATDDGTVVWAVANGPRVAEMLDSLGAGPRSYGLVWAPAPVEPETSPPPTRPATRASLTRRGRFRAIDVRTACPLCRGPGHPVLVTDVPRAWAPCRERVPQGPCVERSID